MIRKRKKVREVLLASNEEIKAVRVLLKFWFPLRKYPKFGVWSYLLKTNKGLIVFDVGSEKSFWIRKTKNAALVMDAVREYFPGETIKEIVLSHYHYDHAGGAPLLQKLVEEECRCKPAIRIHQEDGVDKKIFNVKKTSLEKLFRKTKVDDWCLGEWLEEGERLLDSDWVVCHTPGHTSGAVSIVNENEKVMIGGWMNDEIGSRFIRWAQRFLVDEAAAEYDKTKEKICFYKEKGYKKYYLHPMMNSPLSRLRFK